MLGRGARAGAIRRRTLYWIRRLRRRDPPWIRSARGSVRAARAEAAWLAGDRDRCAAEAETAYATAIDAQRSAGLRASWRFGSGGPAELTTAPPEAAEPYAQQIAGDWAAAAASWDAFGCPYEAARARAESEDEAVLRRALAEFDRLGARPMAGVVTRRLRDLGAHAIARGPRPTTRANHARLTSREMEIWRLLSEGLRNAEIADRLSVSTKPSIITFPPCSPSSASARAPKPRTRWPSVIPVSTTQSRPVTEPK